MTRTATDSLWAARRERARRWPHSDLRGYPALAAGAVGRAAHGVNIGVANESCTGRSMGLASNRSD
jgi:hypothetical protein